MRCARPVLLILFLLAGSLSPPGARAQEARAAPLPDRARSGFTLEQNSPNPVVGETTIPFYLEDSLFENRDSVLVTLRIVNILRQVVAIPRSMDNPATRRPGVINLAYRSPGRKLAYWDGKDPAGRRVPSGVYYCELVVGSASEPQTKKMIVLNPRRRRTFIPWFGKS